MSNTPTNDELYEQYWNSGLKKLGNRYEQLTAYVFKALHDKQTSFKALTLTGDPENQHRIDLTIENGGSSKRILLECLDYDIARKRVEEETITALYDAIDDENIDEVIVITCHGFSTAAMKAAKSKGVKLAVLREVSAPEEADENKRVCMTTRIMQITEPGITFDIPEDKDIDKFSSDLMSAGVSGGTIKNIHPVFLNLADERVQFSEFIEKKIGTYTTSDPGPIVLDVDLTGSTIEVEERGGVPIAGLEIAFHVVHYEDYMNDTSSKIANMVHTALADAELIVYEKELLSYDIDGSTGEVAS